MKKAHHFEDASKMTAGVLEGKKGTDKGEVIIKQIITKFPWPKDRSASERGHWVPGDNNEKRHT